MSFAETRFSRPSASRPWTRYLAKDDWSNRDTASRVRRHSSPQASNQFSRPYVLSYSCLSPLRSYHFFRSHPPVSPFLSPSSTFRSSHGPRLSPPSVSFFFFLLFISYFFP